MSPHLQQIRLLQNDNPYLRDRLRQIFWATGLALFIGMLNLVIFGEHTFGDEHTFGVRSDILLLLGGLSCTLISHKLLTSGKVVFAGTIFLWLCSIVLVFTTWIEGGLYSLIILCIPIVLIFAAFFTGLKGFIAISTFLGVAVLLMGLNHIYDWFPSPPEMFIKGFPRVFSALIIVVLTSYVAWIFGDLLRLSMLELKRENKRVKDSEKIIRKLADYDPLTGLLNRGGAREAFNRLAKNLSSPEKMVFYFIDLDNFKTINDLFDHHEGDKLLNAIATRLQALLGPDDIACRLGGDEFIVVVRADNVFDFDGFAKSLLEATSQPHQIFGTKTEVSASIGVAVINQEGLSFDDVRKMADMAMYKAKQSGKNQYHHYSAKLDKEYMRNLSIVTGLKDAVSNELLDLHYQPKVSLKSNQIESVEALLRWTRENPENIRPDEFIPVIEATELIHDVGAWVVREACKACKQFHEKGHLIRMSVNVAAMQLTRPGFYEVVAEALKEANLAPEYFEIELTEHFLLNENQIVESQIADLKQLGVCLAIDDFGTGYSNMNYLTRLQVDVLKLDRSFISQISHSKDSLVVVTAVIQMARVLGMSVVAEGVETIQEKNLLENLDCDFGQGFLWSKALPEEKLVTFLQSFSERSQLPLFQDDLSHQEPDHSPMFPKGDISQPA